MVEQRSPCSDGAKRRRFIQPFLIIRYKIRKTNIPVFIVIISYPFQSVMHQNHSFIACPQIIHQPNNRYRIFTIIAYSDLSARKRAFDERNISFVVYRRIDQDIFAVYTIPFE